MKSFFRMSYPYILWIAVFIVAPMVMILLYAVTRTGNNILTFQKMGKIRFFDQIALNKADVGKKHVFHICERSAAAADYCNLMGQILCQSQC